MRILKQLAYGFLFLAFFAGMGAGFYRLFLVPPQSCFDTIKNQDEEDVDCGGVVSGCMTCELKSIKVGESEPKIFALGETSSALFVELSNTSSNYGLKLLKYSFEVFNRSGLRLRIVTGETSLYPNEKKYIVDLLDLDRREVSDIDFRLVELAPADWTLRESLPARADLKILNVASADEGSATLITGILQNNSSARIGSVDIAGLAYDAANKITAASSTILEGIAPFAQVPFRIFVPQGKYARVEAYLE